MNEKDDLVVMNIFITFHTCLGNLPYGFSSFSHVPGNITVIVMCVVPLSCGTLCVWYPSPHTLFQKSDTEYLDQKYKISNNANKTLTISKLIPGHLLNLDKNILKILVQGNIAWRSSTIW